MRYTIIIETAGNNYSAYVPDLPGGIITGLAVEETKRYMEKAIAFHLRGMREVRRAYSGGKLYISIPLSDSDSIQIDREFDFKDHYAAIAPFADTIHRALVLKLPAFTDSSQPSAKAAAVGQGAD